VSCGRVRIAGPSRPWLRARRGDKRDLISVMQLYEVNEVALVMGTG